MNILIRPTLTHLVAKPFVGNWSHVLHFHVLYFHRFQSTNEWLQFAQLCMFVMCLDTLPVSLHCTSQYSRYPQVPCASLVYNFKATTVLISFGLAAFEIYCKTKGVFFSGIRTQSNPILCVLTGACSPLCPVHIVEQDHAALCVKQLLK